MHNASINISVLLDRDTKGRTNPHFFRVYMYVYETENYQ